MSELAGKPGVCIAVAVALLVAVASRRAGACRRNSTSRRRGVDRRVIGQTSYAYLGGLRTFAAAVLWNRLEPLFHDYYGDRSVDELVEFLPTMRLVQMLDPQFEQAYYNSSFILARRGRMDDALSISPARASRTIPSSGLLLANYAQLLLIQDKKANLPEMLKLAEQGMRPDVRWANAGRQVRGLRHLPHGLRPRGRTSRWSMRSRRPRTPCKQQGAGSDVERDEGAASGEGN